MFSNIISTQGVVSGKPRIINTRLSVEFLLGLMAEGAGVDDIVATYPQLSVAQVREAIRFAAESLNQERYIDIQKAS